MRRDKLSSTERGNVPVLLSGDLAALLDDYGVAHGVPLRRPSARIRFLTDYPAVIAHMHQRAVAPDPAHVEARASVTVPWEEIRQALLDELGLVKREAIDRALHSAGMPK